MTAPLRTQTTPPADPTQATGLDLSDPATYRLAKNLYFRRFSGRVMSAGVDPDDGFQDMLVGLLRRQNGKSRFDPRRASLSTYLYWAFSGMAINLAASQRLRATHSSVGGKQDAALDAEGTSPEMLTERAMEDLAAELEVPVGVVRALAAGDDPFVAALDAGLDFVEASGLGDALGFR